MTHEQGDSESHTGDHGDAPNEVRAGADMNFAESWATLGSQALSEVDQRVRDRADIKAGPLEQDPDARRIEAEDTREQALGEVHADQQDTAEIQQAEKHPNGAWQGGGRAAQ